MSQKVNFHEEMELALKRVESNTESTELKPKAIQRTNTIDERTQSDGVLTKVLADGNIEAVLQEQARLSLDCLLRLRKYQMVDSMETNPEGGHMMVLQLSDDVRYRQTNWGSQTASV